MTDRRIRELLDDVVRDVSAPDLARSAWARSRTVRRRRAAGAAVATATVVVLGSLLATATPTADVRPDPAAPATTATPAAAEPVQWRGFDVWLGPTLEEETSLPQVSSLFPARIDLDGPLSEEPLESAVAAFGVSSNNVWVGIDLLGADGSLRRLDLVERRPGLTFGPSALSPDGTALVVGEPGAVRVYDLGAQRWTRYPVDAGYNTDVVGWGYGPDTVDLGGGTLLSLRTGAYLIIGSVSPVDYTGIEGFEPWGPVRTNRSWAAQAAFSDQMTAVEAGVDNPEVIVASQTVRGAKSMLVLSMNFADRPTRFKGCCRAAGWLDAETLAFESNSPLGLRLLSWHVTTGAVGLVSKLTPPAGTVVTGSYADLTH